MNYYYLLKSAALLICYKFLCLINCEDIFRQNIGDQMKIGLSNRGYKSVELKCSAQSMDVSLVTEEEFSGVIYTRGSFYEKKSPCFIEVGSKEQYFETKIPFAKCNTKQEAYIYSNVLILQHDKELIMPGDSAFYLECDFSKPRNIVVTAELQSTDAVISRITLVDADPSKIFKTAEKTEMLESNTNSVIITPDLLRRNKDEL